VIGQADRGQRFGRRGLLFRSDGAKGADPAGETQRDHVAARDRKASVELAALRQQGDIGRARPLRSS